MWLGGGTGGGAKTAFVRYFCRKCAPNVRKINPKVPPQEAASIAQGLYQVIKQHGPLTVSNTWNHAKGVQDKGDRRRERTEATKRNGDRETKRENRRTEAIERRSSEVDRRSSSRSIEASNQVVEVDRSFKPGHRGRSKLQPGTRLFSPLFSVSVSVSSISVSIAVEGRRSSSIEGLFLLFRVRRTPSVTPPYPCRTQMYQTYQTPFGRTWYACSRTGTRTRTRYVPGTRTATFPAYRCFIGCGDLNVSHEEIDVSHPDFFSAAKLNGYIPPNKEDCGQPGYTLSERKRFGAILKEGKLVDAYRFLHKEKDMERGFSWSGNPVGKYRGKRMRIDYFVASEKLKDRIVACEMHGQGIELQGFYGSDHCPVSLELSRASPDSSQS